MKIKNLKLKIYGQVQGVFFRQSAKVEADKLGLVGWVRNDPEGSVEALAVGPKDKLDQFIKWCKKGPEGASVDRFDVKWLESSEEFHNFSIK